MSVSSLGVGSGLDLESLVQNMVSMQRDARVASYNNRISDYTAEVSAYGAIKSALESFESAVEKLSDSDFFTGRTAELTQPSSGDIVSVDANEDSSNGTYSISVSQLAQGSRSVSTNGGFTDANDTNAFLAGGTLTFTAGDQTFDVVVAANTSLADLREQINDAADNFGVSANIVDNGQGQVFLSLTSEKTGDGNDLVVTNDNADLDRVSSVATGAGSPGLTIGVNDHATSAMITVDGIDIQSDTNAFDNAVSGLTINALAISNLDSSGNPEVAKANVSFDSETVKETLEEFVESYNSLLAVFDKQTSANSALFGSSLVRGLEGALNSDLMTTFSNAGSLSTIFDLGLEMDNNGSLSIDETKFEEAISDNYDDVATMFSGESGLASLMSGMLESYTGSSGLLQDMVKASEESIDKTRDQLDNYEYRMELYEQQLRSRFTQLDSLLASMNSNGNYLMSQLSGMSSNNS